MRELLFDPVAVRGWERIAVVLCSLRPIWFGFLLVVSGIDHGLSRGGGEAKRLQVAFPGTGAGLLFMAAGAAVSVAALVTGSACAVVPWPGSDSSVHVPRRPLPCALAECAPAPPVFG